VLAKRGSRESHYVVDQAITSLRVTCNNLSILAVAHQRSRVECDHSLAVTVRIRRYGARSCKM
jgi:hypothetical protein